MFFYSEVFMGVSLFRDLNFVLNDVIKMGNLMKFKLRSFICF